MLFCNCLLFNEFMLSSFHKFILIFNIDFLNSIINVLDFDIELLFLLSFALINVCEMKRRRMHEATC